MAPTYSLGPIYDFLWDRLPQFRGEHNKLDVLGLAAAAGVSDKALYKAFKIDRLTPGIALAIIKASKSKIKPADLADFVIR